MKYNAITAATKVLMQRDYIELSKNSSLLTILLAQIDLIRSEKLRLLTQIKLILFQGINCQNLKTMQKIYRA